MISSELHRALARAKADDLRRAADAHRLTHHRAEAAPPAAIQRSVTLRLGSPADREPLARLAELDSSTPPTQPVLLAEVDGQLRAALALADGTIVADPFHLTADLIDLLRARARQLDTTLPIRRSRRLGSWSRLRPGVALNSQNRPVASARSMVASTTQLFEPSLLVQLRAQARRLKLDRALAAGADPTASPLLAARAAQLVDPRTRQRIAARLEQFALTADRPRSRVQTLPLRRAVRPNQEALIALARTLHDGQLTHARGIAMLELILSDGTGPAYTDPSGMRLARQLALAAQGLTGRTPQNATQ
jgi:hypothetical protein